ncbi:MAG: hypothetical protein HQL52_02420 [Magnetococcales bacterium]|nr:hypothetical protein [Magnetococcales bacterium]
MNGQIHLEGFWGSVLRGVLLLFIAAVLGLVDPVTPALAAGDTLEKGVQLFRENKFDKAIVQFRKVQKGEPENPWAAYYMGLLELRKGNGKAAIKQWQLYQRVDPAGAEKNGIPGRLTLLQEEERKQSVAALMKFEQQLSDNPPEPGAIAVFPFENEGLSKYNVLSKGLMALIIADLSKVPGLKVLERGKLQKLLDEIKLSQSGLVREDAQVKTGRMLRAERLVLGEYAVE